MIRVERITERALAEYQIAATLIAAGVKAQDGSSIQPTTPEQERQAFDDHLARPLDYERMRAAILREVTG